MRETTDDTTPKAIPNDASLRCRPDTILCISAALPMVTMDAKHNTHHQVNVKLNLVNSWMVKISLAADQSFNVYIDAASDNHDAKYMLRDL